MIHGVLLNNLLKKYKDSYNFSSFDNKLHYTDTSPVGLAVPKFYDKEMSTGMAIQYDFGDGLKWYYVKDINKKNSNTPQFLSKIHSNDRISYPGGFIELNGKGSDIYYNKIDNNKLDIQFYRNCGWSNFDGDFEYEISTYYKPVEFYDIIKYTIYSDTYTVETLCHNEETISIYSTNSDRLVGSFTISKDSLAKICKSKEVVRDEGSPSMFVGVARYTVEWYDCEYNMSLDPGYYYAVLEDKTGFDFIQVLKVGNPPKKGEGEINLEDIETGKIKTLTWTPMIVYNDGYENISGFMTMGEVDGYGIEVYHNPFIKSTPLYNKHNGMAVIKPNDYDENKYRELENQGSYAYPFIYYLKQLDKFFYADTRWDNIIIPFNYKKINFGVSINDSGEMIIHLNSPYHEDSKGVTDFVNDIKITVSEDGSKIILERVVFE